MHPLKTLSTSVKQPQMFKCSYFNNPLKAVILPVAGVPCAITPLSIISFSVNMHGYRTLF